MRMFRALLVWASLTVLLGGVAKASALQCAPATQTVSVGQTVSISGSGGTGVYNWAAPGSSALVQVGGTATIRYGNPGSFTVIMQDSGGEMASCAVLISNTAVLSTPSPTSPASPALTMEKLVRNVTASGTESNTTNAHPSDTVEFSIRISSVGSGNATGVVVRDALPAGLTYQSGTTTIDTIPAADGIISTGLNLGTLAPGRTVIVRFRATVSSASFFSVGTTTLVNVGSAYAANIGQITDPADIIVIMAASGVASIGLGGSILLAVIVSTSIALLYGRYKRSVSHLK